MNRIDVIVVGGGAAGWLPQGCGKTGSTSIIVGEKSPDGTQGHDHRKRAL